MEMPEDLLVNVSGTYTSGGVTEAIEVHAFRDVYTFQTSNNKVCIEHLCYAAHEDESEPDCEIQFPIFFPVESGGKVTLQEVHMTMTCKEGFAEQFVLVTPQGVTAAFREEFQDNIYRVFPILFPESKPRFCAYCEWHLYNPYGVTQLSCVLFLKDDPERLNRVRSVRRYHHPEIFHACADGVPIRDNYGCQAFESMTGWRFHSSGLFDPEPRKTE